MSCSNGHGPKMILGIIAAGKSRARLSQDDWHSIRKDANEGVEGTKATCDPEVAEAELNMFAASQGIQLRPEQIDSFLESKPTVGNVNLMKKIREDGLPEDIAKKRVMTPNPGMMKAPAKKFSLYRDEDKLTEADERPCGIRASVWNPYREAYVMEHLRCAGLVSDIQMLNEHNERASIDAYVDGNFAEIKVHRRVESSTPLNTASGLRGDPRKYEQLVANNGMFIAADPEKIAFMSPPSLKKLQERDDLIDWKYDGRNRTRDQIAKWDAVYDIPFSEFDHVVHTKNIRLDERAIKTLEATRKQCQAIHDYEQANFDDIRESRENTPKPCHRCGQLISRGMRYSNGMHIACAAYQAANLPLDESSEHGEIPTPVRAKRDDSLTSMPEMTWMRSEEECAKCGQIIKRGDHVGAMDKNGDLAHYECSMTSLAAPSSAPKVIDEDTAKFFITKFPGSCPSCPDPVMVGDQVYWHQEFNRAAHASCA